MRLEKSHTIKAAVVFVVAAASTACQADDWRLQLWLQHGKGMEGGYDPVLDGGPALDASTGSDLVHSCGPTRIDCTSLLHVIASGVECQNGQCVLLAGGCEEGWAHCSQNPNEGCESDLMNDPLNCGMCGSSCPGPGLHATGQCSSGVCGCIPFHGDCNLDWSDGCETYLVRGDNCGACGRVCPVTRTSVGECEFSAGGGQAVCQLCDPRPAPSIHYNCDLDVSNGCEVNGWTDPNNCGGCGIACPEGLACVRGACSSAAGSE